MSLFLYVPSVTIVDYPCTYEEAFLIYDAHVPNVISPFSGDVIPAILSVNSRRRLSGELKGKEFIAYFYYLSLPYEVSLINSWWFYK